MEERYPRPYVRNWPGHKERGLSATGSISIDERKKRNAKRKEAKKQRKRNR